MLRFVYAVAKLKDGGVQFDVMSRAEVDGIRARSKSADNGPWVTDYAAMALKTVVRRLFKFLPVSIEIQQAVTLDEQAEAGVSQQNSAIIDGNFTEVDAPLELGAETPPAATAGAAQQSGKSEVVVDYDVMFSRIAQCADLDVLDILVDELRTMTPGDERTKLEQHALDRRAELGGAQ
jgi:recombination protein RecT